MNLGGGRFALCFFLDLFALDIVSLPVQDERVNLALS